jgi:hypothetical protein
VFWSLRYYKEADRLFALTLGFIVNSYHRWMLAVLLFVSVTASSMRYCVANEQAASPAPIAGYTTHEVEGWVVRVSDRLSQEQPEKTQRALELLAEQLRIVIRVLPAEPLAFVRTVPIWFSPPYASVRPKAEYHSDKEWLEKEGRLKELYQCVEFTTTAIFEREIERMPVIVLHELAHAYHYQVLGFDNALIKTAFERARNSGSYEVVLRNDGNKEKAYALTNAQEYFAESTEAYFGRNDFFPFDREELQQHDPAMVKVLQEVWQVEPDASNAVNVK